MTATPTSASARERVHAMESLAAVIAHELRAGVLGITSAAQLLRYSMPQDPVAERNLGRILLEADRLSALHEALSEYATALPPRFVSADPDEVLSGAVRGMRGALEAKSVVLTHSGRPSTVRLDAEQLSRAFERAIHHVLDRVGGGAALDAVSSVDDGWWTCTVAARQAVDLAKSESVRPTFPIVLAQRTMVAHGGDIVDHGPAEAPLLITIRLPLSLHPE